jgi:uncharacterized alpha/beta hydrolase family protein
LKKRLAVILVLSIFLLTSCTSTDKQLNTGTNETATTTTTNQNPVEKTAVPTLFIHGYSGNEHSFGGMIQRLEVKGEAKKELILTVSNDGQISAEGSLSGEKDNPMVQVLFEDNKNNEWNQAEWIRSALVYLKEQFQVEKINLVGHSMGGVSSLRFLGAYGQDASLPAVEKFVAIGAPFNEFDETPNMESVTNELKNGPINKSGRYQEYQQTVANIPASVDVFLIGGQLSETDLSDGTVPLASALAVNALLSQNGNRVQTEIIEGQEAQHSQLHENLDVDKLVGEFLWETQK